MVRGLERRIIFKDDTNRADFVARVATLAEAEALSVYAWALLPNHAHLLVRTGRRPLARSLRRLLTGYAEMRDVASLCSLRCSTGPRTVLPVRGHL
jgi:REP element-mobilizing transposase RayT